MTRKQTPAQHAASLANLVKARAAAAKKPRTSAQLVAAKTNLVKARATHYTHTAKQRAAAKANLAKARKVAAHLPRTAKQKAAARANLAKARAAYRRKHHTHHVGQHRHTHRRHKPKVGGYSKRYSIRYAKYVHHRKRRH